MPPPIVFVHLGPAPLPACATDALAQAALWNPGAELVLLAAPRALAAAATAIVADFGASGRADAAAAANALLARVAFVDADSVPPTPALARFRATTRLNGEWRDGFWRYAAERVLLLHAWLVAVGQRRCVHLENDTLLYAAVDGPELAPFVATEARAAPPLCLATMATKDTLLLNVLIVNDAAALGALADAMVAATDNEMAAAHRFAAARPDLVALLPSQPAADAGGGGAAVVDAAPYGQWLAGPDPRNFGWPPGTSMWGMVNTDAGFDVSAFQYRWADCSAASGASRLWRPQVRRDGTAPWLPLLSLHVHCKVTRPFRSDAAAPPPVTPPDAAWRTRAPPPLSAAPAALNAPTAA
jgi:hypothetical protein